MPKKSKQFGIYPDRIEAMAPAGTRLQLIAIGYHMGTRGEISVPLRNFIIRGIRDYIANLKGKDLEEFKEILQNVELQQSEQIEETKLQVEV